jgi:uncharacterized repeat protein (TIGR03847 family)
MPSRELDPITRLTTDAVGDPGRRTFYLQAASGVDQVTLVVEKEQVRALAERLEMVLPQLAEERPEDPEEVQAAEATDLSLAEPLDPDFRVGQLSLDYDPGRDRFVMVATELLAEGGDERPDELQDPQEVRLWVTRPQLRVLARHGAEVVARGRPPCPLCGNPLDPSGHICPAQNGHRPVLA